MKCSEVQIACNPLIFNAVKSNEVQSMGLNLQVVLAASHGCSMEQEARDIFRKAVQPQLSGAEFAQRISQRLWFTGWCWRHATSKTSKALKD